MICLHIYVWNRVKNIEYINTNLNCIKFKIEQNSKEHQMKDGECGMFTMYFIINMLKKQSFKQFKNKFKGGGDEHMNKLRNILFN